MGYQVIEDYGTRQIFDGSTRHVKLVPALVQLGIEIALDPYFCQLTNLGELGDQSHVEEGFYTDHNPIRTYGGVWYIGACDYGGPAAVQQRFFEFLVSRYRARDSRLWAFGYPKTNGQIVRWTDGVLQPSSGDFGHVHLSATQRDGYNPSFNSWVSALGSRSTWGLTQWRTGKQPSPVASVKGLQMFEIVGATGSDGRYLWAPGVWRLLRNPHEMAVALKRPGCLNKNGKANMMSKADLASVRWMAVGK